MQPYEKQLEELSSVFYLVFGKRGHQEDLYKFCFSRYRGTFEPEPLEVLVTLEVNSVYSDGMVS
jgi:hypothetical protein